MSSEKQLNLPLLGALCVSEGLLSQAQLDECLQIQTQSPSTPIGQILRQAGYLTEADLDRMLVHQQSFRRALAEEIDHALPTKELSMPGENIIPISVPLLGALCVAEGLLSQAQLDECLQIQTQSPSTPIGQILRQAGYMTEADLDRMLIHQQSFRRAMAEQIDYALPTKKLSVSQEKTVPILQWGALTDDYRASARTAFAELHVFIDPLPTSLATDMRFCARVETTRGGELAAVDDLISLSAARIWCEARYAELLHGELIRMMK